MRQATKIVFAMPRFQRRKTLVVAFVMLSLMTVAACGGVDRSPDTRATPFPRQESPLNPTATPVMIGESSATIGDFTFAPVSSRFLQDQPGLSSVEITLDVSVDPSVSVAALRWGPRLEFTAINLVPTRRSPSGEELKIVARISWGRSNFIDLRPEPSVTRLNYNLVGGSTRSFVTGFGARIPTSVTNNLTFTLLEGTVAEHQAGQARVISTFPLPDGGEHLPPRLSEVEPNGILSLGPTFTISCRGETAILNGVLQNFTEQPVSVELIELTLYDENGIPIDEYPVNRFAQQTGGDNLNRRSDDPLLAGEDVTFEFQVPVGVEACPSAEGWALLRGNRLLGAGLLP